MTYLADANILVHATDSNSEHNATAREWPDDRLAGHPQTVAMPWPMLPAFLRLITARRLFSNPLSPQQAWSRIEDWPDRRAAWVPVPDARHRLVLGELLVAAGASGNLGTDAHLAAPAKEHGLTIASADSVFAKFDDVKWVNPLAGARRAG